MKSLHFLLCCLLLALVAVSDSGEAVRCRYFWVVRDDLASPASIDSLIDKAAAAGANGLIAQVAGRAEAYYESDILPSASVEPGFDPLEYLINRARPRGMEVHAWVNAFLVWSAPYPPSDSSHIWHAHPEWFMTDGNHRSTRDYTRPQCEASSLVGATLSPAVPEVRHFLGRVTSEIAVNYDVDGIHLDYIRYPNPTFGFEPVSVGAFFFKTGLNARELVIRHGSDAELEEAWSQWKRDMVTETVETVRAALRRNAPGTLLSCAVMADPYEAASHYSCDWRKWLEDGLVDFVCTMAYTTNQSKARELALLGAGTVPERVVHGIGVYNQSVPSALAGAETAVENECAGICVFSLNSLSSSDTWMLSQFWGEGRTSEHPLETAVFQRVSKGNGI